MSTTSSEKLAGIESEIIKLLQAQHTCVMATMSVKGGVLVHGMHFVSDGLTVYVSSLRGTRKLADIGQDSRVAYAIWQLGSSHATRHEARNLQMQALAEAVTDEVERKRAMDMMGEKEPWSKGSLLIRTNRWIRMRPVEALWQHGAEEIDSRQILYFSPEGRITDAVLYVDYMNKGYGPAQSETQD